MSFRPRLGRHPWSHPILGLTTQPHTIVQPRPSSMQSSVYDRSNQPSSWSHCHCTHFLISPLCPTVPWDAVSSVAENPAFYRGQTDRQTDIMVTVTQTTNTDLWHRETLTSGSHMQVTCRSHASHMQVTSRSHAGHMLVTCWSHAGHMLVTCWSHAGHMLVTCWSHAGCMK